MYLVFDTETTGIVDFRQAPDAKGQPRMVQLGALLLDQDGKEVAQLNTMIRPNGFAVPDEASMVHGITTEKASRYGVPLRFALHMFNQMAKCAEILVAYNIQYDDWVLRGEAARECCDHPMNLQSKRYHCAMLLSKDILKLPGKYRDYKWPKLQEAYRFFFNCDFDGAHDAMADVRATAAVYLKIRELKGVLV